MTPHLSLWFCSQDADYYGDTAKQDDVPQHWFAERNQQELAQRQVSTLDFQPAVTHMNAWNDLKNPTIAIDSGEPEHPVRMAAERMMISVRAKTVKPPLV